MATRFENQQENPNAYWDGQAARLRAPVSALPYPSQDPATLAGLGLPQQYTENQSYDGDPAIMQQAYADQEARLGPMRLPSETSDEGLGLPTSTSQQPMSSGGGEGDGKFNWLMALGGALQSGGAAHFGNYNVPQQYFQLKQQRDQMAAQAEERKQTFAMQQAKLAEEKKQHMWSQVFQTMTNENLGAAQRLETLKGMKDNPYAQEAAQNVNAKMIGDFKAAGEFLPRKPEEYMQALQNGEMDWHQVATETKMGLKLREKVSEKQADTMAYQTLQRMAKEQPDNEPLQEAWMEAQREKQEKIAKANVTIASAPSDIKDRRLKPALTQAHIDETGRDKSTMNKLAEGLVDKPWKDLTQEERKQVLAFEQSREVEKQEAGARAREQVKTESSLAPGVMIHKTMTDMVKGVKDLFLDESESTLKRVGQMAVTRGKFFAGDESMRKWSQMEDGMRATLARMAMEVGNLAATEQDRAKQLVPDLYGSFRGVPDSKQVAEKKLQLLGEFLQAGLEGPQGPDAQSRVQNKLRETLTKLDKVDPLPPVGEVSKDEEAMIKSMQAEGKDKRSIQAAILQKRGVQ